MECRQWGSVQGSHGRAGLRTEGPGEAGVRSGPRRSWGSRDPAGQLSGHAVFLLPCSAREEDPADPSLGWGA